jgi:pimeloyl-ACP methyl ester carboxylesterase
VSPAEPGRDDGGVNHLTPSTDSRDRLDEEVQTGTLDPGMPFVRVGAGEDLLFIPGLTPHHRVPVGTDLRFQVSQLRPLAAIRTVWWVSPQPGLPPHVTIADIAEDYARVLRERFPAPVDVVGISTGATIAFQLAADHPELVRTLVAVGADHLSARGRRRQRRFAAHMRAGELRRAAGVFFATMGGGRASSLLLRIFGFLLGRRMYSGDASDLLAMVEAEDTAGLGQHLSRISAPTLIIGGSRDRFYGQALFEATATAIPNARLVLLPGRGHFGTQLSPQYTSAMLSFLEAPSDQLPGHEIRH